jgi:hypothetical protein
MLSHHMCTVSGLNCLSTACKRPCKHVHPQACVVSGRAGRGGINAQQYIHLCRGVQAEVVGTHLAGVVGTHLAGVVGTHLAGVVGTHLAEVAQTLHCSNTPWQ